MVQFNDIGAAFGAAAGVTWADAETTKKHNASQTAYASILVCEPLCKQQDVNDDRRFASLRGCSAQHCLRCTWCSPRALTSTTAMLRSCKLRVDCYGSGVRVVARTACTHTTASATRPGGGKHGDNNQQSRTVVVIGACSLLQAHQQAGRGTGACGTFSGCYAALAVSTQQGPPKS